MQYQLGKILGEGGFSTIYYVENSCGQLVAKLAVPEASARIIHEFEIYCKLTGTPLVPMAYCLQEIRGRQAIVMENTGVALQNYFQALYPLLSKGMLHLTVALYAEKMIRALQAVHLRGVIHGDIHPGNFTIEIEHQQLVVRLIDFGGAVAVGESRGPEQNTDINYFFASADRTSSPSEGPSIADDLASLAYVVAFLANGRLPWMSAMGREGRVRKPKDLIELKCCCGAEFLSIGLPNVFYDFFSFALNIKPSAAPQEIEYETYATAFQEFVNSSK